MKSCLNSGLWCIRALLSITATSPATICGSKLRYPRQISAVVRSCRCRRPCLRPGFQKQSLLVCSLNHTECSLNHAECSLSHTKCSQNHTECSLSHTECDSVGAGDHVCVQDSKSGHYWYAPWITPNVPWITPNVPWVRPNVPRITPNVPWMRWPLRQRPYLRQPSRPSCWCTYQKPTRDQFVGFRFYEKHCLSTREQRRVVWAGGDNNMLHKRDRDTAEFSLLHTRRKYSKHHADVCLLLGKASGIVRTLQWTTKYSHCLYCLLFQTGVCQNSIRIGIRLPSSRFILSTTFGS
jgi:hypothetical protein